VQPARSPWRSVGLWLSALLVGYMLVNAVRAIVSPISFASSFGIPLNNPSDDAFVLVYATRALFLGLFGLALFLRRSYASLALFALVATVMPIGDALLVALRGGELAIVVRHSLTAGVVLLAWFLTQRWVRRSVAPHE
jgi:hypothetical protein